MVHIYTVQIYTLCTIWIKDKEKFYRNKEGSISRIKCIWGIYCEDLENWPRCYSTTLYIEEFLSTEWGIYCKDWEKWLWFYSTTLYIEEISINRVNHWVWRVPSVQSCGICYGIMAKTSGKSAKSFVTAYIMPWHEDTTFCMKHNGTIYIS